MNHTNSYFLNRLLYDLHRQSYVNIFGLNPERTQIPIIDERRKYKKKFIKTKLTKIKEFN
jgi:hypothetical protein